MNSTFNGQILVDKLARLNNSQQSIETLSHWCIFHRKKAKQVVETWNRQFHLSRREQRLSFLYLANDILQNSRRKGLEFVNEFWKVLPDALGDVLQSGDEFGRNAASRLIDIWEERKVFGSRGQRLKEELLGNDGEGKARISKITGIVAKPSATGLEKVISSYKAVYEGYIDEEAILVKCRSAVSCIEKVEEVVQHDNSANLPSLLEELQEQCNLISECIEQLRTLESSRATLVSHLRGFLNDQEFKLDQLRDEVQVMQSRFDQAGTLVQQLLIPRDESQVPERTLDGSTMFSDIASNASGNLAQEHFVSSVYMQHQLPSSEAAYMQQQLPSSEGVLTSEDDHRRAAADVAAKLAASTSSAQMLSYVLSSLASEGVISSVLDSTSSGDLSAEKRVKLENGSAALAQINPSFHYTEQMQHMQSSPHNQMPLPPTSSPMSPAPPTAQPPLPPSLPPPPPPPPQLVQSAGSVANMPYSYGTIMQQPAALSGYGMMMTPVSGMLPYSSPLNVYQGFQLPDGCYYGQQSISAAPSVSRP